MSLSNMAARRLLVRNGMRVNPFGISSTRTVVAPVMRNMVARRGFMFSARLASPTAAAKPKPKPKATSTKAKATTTTAAARKKSATTTKAKKTTTTKAATKRKPAVKAAAKKKAAPKKKKAAPKVEKPATPRNDPSLRPPPQRVSGMLIFIKRMVPTLSPKPETPQAGIRQIAAMWKSMTEEEKKPFVDEAAIELVKRREAYNKWRANLTQSEVRIINEYRTRKGFHKKLGTPSDPAKKRPAPSFIKFYSEALKDGRIDTSKAPTGTSPAIYATTQASKMWKSMTESQKAAYKS